MFDVSKFVPDDEHAWTALIFCFHLEKIAANRADYFEKLIVNMLHREIRANDGFDVSKLVTFTQDKKKDNEHGVASNHQYTKHGTPSVG